MACPLKDRIKDKIVGNSTSYKVLNNKVIIPITNKWNKEATYKIASQRVNEVNKLYNSDKFGPCVSLDTTLSNGTGINIHPSNKLIAADEVKQGNKTLSEVGKIFMQEGNQYFIDGEVYPTYEDASKFFSKLDKETSNSTEEELSPILDKLKERFNIPYEFINDKNEKYKGYFDGDKVIINLTYATLDTPFHEFAHPFVRIMRKENPASYLKAARYIRNTEEGQAILKRVRETSPKLKNGDDVEEAVVKAIGLLAEDKIKDKSLLESIKDLVKKIMEVLGISKINPKTFSVSSIQDIVNIMVSDDKVDVSGIKEYMDTEETQYDKETKKKKAFEKQFTLFKRRLNTLDKKLKSLAEGSPLYNQYKKEYDYIKSKLDALKAEEDYDVYKELSEHLLSRVDEFITLIENGKEVSDENIHFTLETLKNLYDFEGLEKETRDLFRRLYPIIKKRTTSKINAFSTIGEITDDMIESQDKDISHIKKWVGALSDIPNYIANTIGKIIKAAQNKASSKNKELQTKIQNEVNKLEEWAKSQGITLEDAYKMIMQEYDNGYSIIQPYYKGEFNPKFADLTKPENKPLYNFYKFYLKTLEEAEASLPYKIRKDQLINIAKDDLIYKLKNILPNDIILNKEFVPNEELLADKVPDLYRKKLPKDKISLDLGSSLLQFGAYSNMHYELSKALPEVRMLQMRLEYEDIDGRITKRQLVKSDGKKAIYASESNLYNMIDTVINMQLKGEMDKGVLGNITKKEIKDKNGKIIGYKRVPLDKVVDLGLKYNSLLRIGLSPITAVANVLFGDVSNIIEAVGGRHFTLKNLTTATNIFFNQVKFSDEKDTDLYKWLEKLNPLQELDDYNLNKEVKIKKLDTEGFIQLAYTPQKVGELFLQSRTMLAVLLKKGYIDGDGKTTKEGEKLTEKELTILSDEIQKLNQMIHGRYSSREAATLQQSSIYRMAIQFRKWIPSAIEARFDDKHIDPRLGVEVEGRYITFKNLLVNLKDTINRLESGTLTELEIYNMKKNLIELTILAFTIVSYAWLDDDEDDEKKKNPLVKTSLTLLDRVSGDLSFFYNPIQVNNLALNAVPLAKTTKDLLTVFKYTPYMFDFEDKEAYYQRGSFKGHHKFYKSLGKSLIGVRPYQDLEKLFNDQPLDEFKNW